MAANVCDAIAGALADMIFAVGFVDEVEDCAVPPLTNECCGILKLKGQSIVCVVNGPADDIVEENTDGIDVVAEEEGLRLEIEPGREGRGWSIPVLQAECFVFTNNTKLNHSPSTIAPGWLYTLSRLRAASWLGAHVVGVVGDGRSCAVYSEKGEFSAELIVGTIGRLAVAALGLAIESSLPLIPGFVGEREKTADDALVTEAVGSELQSVSPAIAIDDKWSSLAFVGAKVEERGSS